MSEQITIITGGGGSIGRGVCQAFRKAGARSIAIDLDPSAATDVYQ